MSPSLLLVGAAAAAFFLLRRKTEPPALPKTGTGGGTSATSGEDATTKAGLDARTADERAKAGGNALAAIDAIQRAGVNDVAIVTSNCVASGSPNATTANAFAFQAQAKFLASVKLARQTGNVRTAVAAQATLEEALAETRRRCAR